MFFHVSFNFLNANLYRFLYDRKLALLKMSFDNRSAEISRRMAVLKKKSAKNRGAFIRNVSLHGLFHQIYTSFCKAVVVHNVVTWHTLDTYKKNFLPKNHNPHPLLKINSYIFVQTTSITLLKNW